MPTLHGTALAHYLTSMEQISLKYFARWETLEQLTWFPELRKMTFEIASFLLIGGKAGAENDRLFDWFGELSQGLFSLPLRWHGTPFGTALQAREQIRLH